jgi:poly(A) polymerase
MPLVRAIVDKTLRTPQGERGYNVVEHLTDAGFDTWWVGGCVRDMLQGIIPTDIDVATAATPEQVCSIFPRARDEASALGSVRVLIGTETFEVTTFREDDEASNGRHPTAVVFGTREQDACRRDFTVNALYWHPISQQIYDPFNGERDLKEKLVRFIGEPGIRIRHDALRMLRAVRLRATISGQYHPDTYRALQECASMVDVLSGSRQLEELEKMLVCPHPEIALEDLWEIGILQRMLIELHACKGIAQPADYHHEGDVWNHLIACAKAFREEHAEDVRLAAVFHDCGKAKTFGMDESRIRFDQHASVSADLTAAVLDRLQCPRKRREKIVWLIRHHMMMGSFAKMSEERKAHWYFHPWFEELLQLFWLDIAGTDPSDFSLYDSIAKDRQTFLDAHPAPPKQLLTGEEVMEVLRLREGEAVGEALRKLHEAQVKGVVKTKRDAKEFLLKNSQPKE